MLLTSASLLGLAVSTSYALAASAGVAAGEMTLHQGAGQIVLVADMPGATAPTGGTAGPAATQALHAAQAALNRRQTAVAEEALERAETRLLDRSVASAAAGRPDTRPVIDEISQARQALQGGDVDTANRLVAQALTTDRPGDGKPGISSVIAVSNNSDTGEPRAVIVRPDNNTGMAPLGVFQGGIDPAIERAVNTGQGSAYGVDAKIWQGIVNQPGGS
jgi:hypothetical protein